MVSKYCSHFWFILSENLWVLKCIPVQVIQQYFILINNRLYPVVRDLTEPACSLIFQSLHLDFLFFIIKMLFLLCKVKFNYFRCRYEACTYEHQRTAQLSGQSGFICGGWRVVADESGSGLRWLSANSLVPRSPRVSSSWCVNQD